MTAKALFRHMAALAALAKCAAPLEAAPSADHEAAVGRCIRKSASGRRWLEITLWGLRDQEGGRAGDAISNPNGSQDLGPLQINSWWVPRLSVELGNDPATIRYWLVHDICFNVDVGRWIFLTALRTEGDYWDAVGAYHSPSAPRAARYATMVAHRIVRRFGRGAFHE